MHYLKQQLQEVEKYQRRNYEKLDNYGVKNSYENCGSYNKQKYILGA